MVRKEVVNKIYIIRLEEQLKGKPKEELIVPLNFNIVSANYGYSSVIFEVNSIFANPNLKNNISTPIKSIQYEDFCTLEKGDVMRAYIEKYRVKKRGRSSGPPLNDGNMRRKYYFERDFKEKEVVHKIEKLDKNSLGVLATFESN